MTSGQRSDRVHMLPEPREGWVLYDGECGVCSRWVPAWGPRLARLGLDIAPLQSAWVRERIRLGPDDLVTDIRLLGTNGTVISGADVYRYIMKRIWWAYPFYLLSRVAGLSHAFNWAYRTFAKHRTHFSASCGMR